MDPALIEPMDPESLAKLLRGYEACMHAMESTELGPECLIDVCRLMLLAAAGYVESRGESMPPSKQAVREALGMLAGILRANEDM